MPKYTQEDLQGLYEEVVHTTFVGKDRRIWNFIMALKTRMEFRWNRLKKIKHRYYDEYRTFLRLPLSQVPKYINDPKFAPLARWRLRLGK